VAPAPPAVPPLAPAAPVQARPPAPSVPSRAEATPTPAVVPGFLVVKAKPWGKLVVDDKVAGDVEGIRRFSLPPGTHTLRLMNGKKLKTWTVEIESGKTAFREGNFLEE